MEQKILSKLKKFDPKVIKPPGKEGAVLILLTEMEVFKQ